MADADRTRWLFWIRALKHPHFGLGPVSPQHDILGPENDFEGLWGIMESKVGQQTVRVLMSGSANTFKKAKK